MKKDIFLIRHSTTDVNADKRGSIMCGSTNAHINEYGIELARKTRSANSWDTESGGIETVSAIYCSTLDRTYETASEIFPDLIEKGLPVHKLHAFDETNFGDFELCPKYELPENILYLWDNDAASLIFPNGDSLKERTDDAYETLLRLCAENEKPIIVVSSCTILRLLLTKVYKLPIDDFHGIKMGNCEVTHLKYDYDINNFIVVS